LILLKVLIFESSHHHDSKGAIVKIHSAITIVLLWSGLTFANAQPAARSTSEGVFTDEQAQRGAMAYSKNCAGCHGSALRSTDREVPNLTGESFKRWVGGTLGEKFEMVRDTMPPRDERSLPDEVYLDILTFILRANKVPVGSHELKPDPETLKQITIAEPVP
jgi:Cytochrome C oxidase, cbb3-type, subunit III